MELLVNGEQRALKEPISISDFLALHNLNAKTIVVEHNRIIVPRDRYGETILRAGDEIEIVQMMAGG